MRLKGGDLLFVSAKTTEVFNTYVIYQVLMILVCHLTVLRISHIPDCAPLTYVISVLTPE